MRIAPVVSAALVLALSAGCASVAKVESGQQTIGGRLTVHLDGAWNRISAPGLGPAETWTMEGLPVDQLSIFSGLKDGEAIHDENRGGATRLKSFQFRSAMQPEDIAALFEGAYTRDGSRFNLLKLEPVTFGGIKGIMFDYALTRKIDNVQLSGVGYVAISRGELFAIVYSAPRLTFFSRHIAKVEQISASARIRE
jgi:hypothetical protein